MLKIREKAWLPIFLSLLLISNSSFALEILTHDSHQHAEVAGMYAGHEMMMSSLKMQDNSDVLNSHGGHAEHGDQNCICDEICCLSSVDIGAFHLESHRIPKVSRLSINLSLYQSISLDLVVPPPTHVSS